MAWLTDEKRLNKESGKKETYFAIQWRTPEGKTRTKGIGFVTRQEAKQMLTVFEGKLAAGEPVEPPRTASGFAPADTPPAPEVPTLAAYLEDVYLPVVKRDKSVKTDGRSRQAAIKLKEILGAKLITQIDYKAVDGFITARRGEGKKTRTVAIEMHLLRQCLLHAEACKVIPEMPRLPKVQGNDQKPHKFLSPEESRLLLAALKPLDVQPHEVTRGKPPIRRDRWTYLAVLMALNLGMRRAEILTRRWEDVRWRQGRNGAILVGRQASIGFDVKTRKERTVPLTPELREELLKAHAEAGLPAKGWIYPAPHDPSKPRGDFGIALRRACIRAGVPVVGPHSLRHTWASRLAMAGVDRKALMELGGWSSGQMLDRVYAHVTTDHLDDVMARSGLEPTPLPTGQHAEDTRGERST